MAGSIACRSSSCFAARSSLIALSGVLIHGVVVYRYFLFSTFQAKDIDPIVPGIADGSQYPLLLV